MIPKPTGMNYPSFWNWHVLTSWIPSPISYIISKSSPNGLVWKITLKVAIIYVAFTSAAKVSKHSPFGCPTKHFCRGHFPSLCHRHAATAFAHSQLMQSCGIAQKQRACKQEGDGLPITQLTTSRFSKARPFQECPLFSSCPIQSLSLFACNLFLLKVLP